MRHVMTLALIRWNSSGLMVPESSKALAFEISSVGLAAAGAVALLFGLGRFALRLLRH